MRQIDQDVAAFNTLDKTHPPLADGTTLVLEVKGQDSAQNQTKRRSFRLNVVPPFRNERNRAHKATSTTATPAYSPAPD